MSEKFDAIVVGGGLAGITAAYVLAKAGQEVLLIERGNYCGAKNVTGGRLYGHSLEKIIPNFAEEAPIERKIVKERISMTTAKGGMTIEYGSEKLKDQKCASYSVLRAKFDKWYAEKAENEGAMIVTGIRVDDVIVQDGKVVGVDCGGEEMMADVVILADGVNSLLAQKLGMKQELKGDQVAVGVKEVIKFDEKTICERFGVAPGEGAAWMFAGDPTDGNIGGGFLYTNKESVSVGIVATISDIGRSDVSIPDMVERLKNHPAVAPVLAGGTLLEYSAHLVTEGGYKMVPELCRDGVLLAGDAAAFVINLGYTVRGMDFAIESGRLAAEAVLKAKEANDFSAESLSVYKTMLEKSFVMKDLKHYKDMPEFMECHEVFNQIPAMVDDIMGGMFVVDGSDPASMVAKALPAIGKAGGVGTLIKVATKAMRGM